MFSIRLSDVSTVLFGLAIMLFSSAAQAMDIQKFDKMAGEDQGDYVVLLIEGAQKVLIDEGNGWNEGVPHSRPQPLFCWLSRRSLLEFLASCR